MTRRNGLPQYVSEYRDRHGRWRYKARKKGFATLYFKAVPPSPEFYAEYRAWREAASPSPGRKRTLSGSVADVVARYYKSTEWQGLAPATRKVRRNIFERIREEHGDKSFAKLETEHVQRMVEVKGPEAGRNFLKMVRALARVAVADKLRGDDPTAGVKTIRHKTEGFHSWTDEEILAFEARHPLGTRARLAFDLLLYTGQRRGDVVLLGRQHLRDGRFHLTQGKTGTALVVPVHPALRVSMEAAPKANMTFLVTEYGKPFSAAGFGNWFRNICNQADLPHCSAHGLRKAAARRLA